MYNRYDIGQNFNGTDTSTNHFEVVSTVVTRDILLPSYVKAADLYKQFMSSFKSVVNAFKFVKTALFNFGK